MAKLSIGAAAPAFTLEDQAGERVSLKDYRDRKTVVLYFYPKAMTPGCTAQACGLRDAKSRLSRLGAAALGVSPDPVRRLKKFEEKESLNFRLLSDEDHAVAERYGAWGLKKFMGREYMGVLRTTFVIDRKGRVAHVFDQVKTKTHHEDVLEVLRHL